MPTARATASATAWLSPLISQTSMARDRSIPTAAAAPGRTGSATPSRPTTWPSRATNTAVCASFATRDGGGIEDREVHATLAEEPGAPREHPTPHRPVRRRQDPPPTRSPWRPARPSSALMQPRRWPPPVGGPIPVRPPPRARPGPVLRDPGDGADADDLGSPVGEGARLVEDDGVHTARGLERGAAPDEDARLGGATGADHDRGRRRETHGAWARDDEHGDRGDHGIGQRWLRVRTRTRPRT